MRGAQLAAIAGVCRNNLLLVHVDNRAELGVRPTKFANGSRWLAMCPDFRPHLAHLAEISSNVP